jgi:hypothetical protein
MSTLPPALAEHPEVVAIAIDLILHPSRRRLYPPRVLVLADAAIEHLRGKLASSTEPVAPDDLPR